MKISLPRSENFLRTGCGKPFIVKMVALQRGGSSNTKIHIPYKEQQKTSLGSPRNTVKSIGLTLFSFSSNSAAQEMQSEHLPAFHGVLFKWLEDNFCSTSDRKRTYTLVEPSAEQIKTEIPSESLNLPTLPADADKIDPFEKGSDHIVDPDEKGSDDTDEKGSDHIVNPTGEKESGEKPPAFWDKFIASQDHVVGPVPAGQGNTATESDPHLVTSSGERVLVTKSGWALNRGQIPLISFYPVTKSGCH
eukprot:sb/3468806/